MYAMGINDEALVPGEDRFLQIVSCNTHNIAVPDQDARDDDGAAARILERGRFVCMRRANDVSQDSGFAPAPSVGKHDDPSSARTTRATLRGCSRRSAGSRTIFSSAMKLNTQYMHSLWFDLELSEPTITSEEAHASACAPTGASR